MQPNILKSAMLNGLIMGVIFSLNFLLSISKVPSLTLLSYVVVTFILVGMYRLTVRFRDVDCEGVITYGKAYSFILLTFFFAAIISSVVKFVYFKYINPNYLDQLLQESMKALETLRFPIDEAAYLQMGKMMKPASFTLQYIWLNVLMGSFVGLIMAAFIKRDKNIFIEK
jgi:hypothetical protein